MKTVTKLIAALAAVLVLRPIGVSAVSAGDISAKGAVLIEAESGDIVYEKNAHARMPMASTTKIMTALVTIEAGGLDESHKIPKEAVGIEGSSAYLTEGETLTIRELLYCLMLSSANDAATAIAYIVAGGVDEFAVMMNDTAARLGLCDTHFTNPHGLDDEGHYTTAADLAKLTRHALSNEIFREIVSTYKTAVPMKNGEGTRVLVNHNRMLKLYKGAIGVKTGFTKTSGRCLVSAAERDGVTLIAVTLSAPSDWSDHRKMLDYGFGEYTRVSFAEAGEYTASLPIMGGTADTVRVTNTEALSKVMHAAEAGEVSYRYETTGTLFAPVKEGDTVGRIVFEIGGKYAGEVPLIACESIDIPKKSGFFDKIKEIFKGA